MIHVVGRSSIIDMEYNEDRSIRASVLIFERSLDSILDVLELNSVDDLLGNEQLWNGDFDNQANRVDFECIIPQEHELEALRKLVDDPDEFAAWVDSHDGYNGTDKYNRADDWRA